MANLTDDRADGRQEGVLVDVLHNGNKIYAGSVVTAGADGFAKAGAAGEGILGVAMEQTPSDRTYIRVWMEGVFDFNCASAVGVQANVGKNVVITDDNTVALAADEDATQIVGKIVNINGTTSVRVKI